MSTFTVDPSTHRVSYLIQNISNLETAKILESQCKERLASASSYETQAKVILVAGACFVWLTALFAIYTHNVVRTALALTALSWGISRLENNEEKELSSGIFSRTWNVLKSFLTSHQDGVRHYTEQLEALQLKVSFFERNENK